MSGFDVLSALLSITLSGLGCAFPWSTAGFWWRLHLLNTAVDTAVAGAAWSLEMVLLAMRYLFPSQEQLHSTAGHVRYSTFICWSCLSHVTSPLRFCLTEGCGGGNCCQVNRSSPDSDVPLAAPVLPSWSACCPEVSRQRNKNQPPDSRRRH